MKKKLVVIVGGYYPYFGNSMGLVLEGISSYLAIRFDLTVLSLKRNCAQTDLEPFIHNGARVVTVSSALHDAILNHSPWAHVFCRIVSLLSIGRFEDYWIGMMVKALQRLYIDNPFDAILSLGFPMQMHEAAMKFKNRHSYVKWITYSADSCVGNTYLVGFSNNFLKKIAAGLLIRRERVFRTNADYNFVSREIYNATLNSLKFIEGKCAILDYTIKPKKQLVRDNIGKGIKIVYTGGMPVRMRDPAYFLKVFELLSGSLDLKLDVYLIGEQPMSLIAAQGRMPDSIYIHPPVSHEEIERIYEDSDVLLNLENDSDVFAPSKLFDYVSTGKPIIDVFYKGRAVNPVVLRHPYVFRLENFGNAKRDAVMLQDFLLRVKGRRLSVSQIETIYADYAPSAIVEKIASVIE